MTLENLEKVSARLAHDGRVLHLVLSEPPGNVLDSVMVRSLRRAVEAARKMPEVRLLVLSGEGRHFSFGASVEEHRPEPVAGMLENFHGLFRDLMASDLPLLARVSGQCLGGGLELASFCDWLFVEEGAKLGQPEIKLGVLAPLGSLLLPWRCGAQGAGMLLTGESVNAEIAGKIGLADRVLPPSEAETIVDGWIEKNILPLSATSLRLARRAARWHLHDLLGRGLDEVERLYLDDLMSTHDAVEGIAAFLEKRAPVWSQG